MRRLLSTIALVAMMLLAACNATVSSANTPPAGSIWFGNSFDPKTFAINGQGTSFAANQPVAMVAHLSRKSTGETLAIEVSGTGYNGPMGGSNVASGNDVIGQLLPSVAFPMPASVTISILDAGGNVLASGSMTVR